MDLSCFQAAAWYRALSLTERIASLQTAQHQRVNGEMQTDLAKRRLERWRSQSPFNTGSYFAQRLAMDGLSENELLYLLGEPIEDLQIRCAAPPAWLLEFAQAFSRPAPYPHAIFPLEVQQGQELVGLLEVIEPLISQGRDRLHQGVQDLIAAQTRIPFDPRTVELLILANLPGQLLPLLTRTLVLELHVARLEELLEGNTPNERFQSFLQRLRQRHIALALFQEYPVLGYQLALRIDQWVTFSLEFLYHLCVDWENVRAQFSPDDPGILVALEDKQSERHQGGKTVLIAKFSSGFQIVYKPKPLAVEVHFQELLAWLNQRGDHPPFRTLNILARGTYGWVEFVTAQSCTSLAEIQRFYERQGAYLALLYALRAIDFHSENIIAAGEHPMLVDLESLFQPDIGNSPTNRHSVLWVGLLPRGADGELEGAGLSGLGAAPGQLASEQAPYWQGIGTDEMKLGRQQLTMLGTQNRPTLDGMEVDLGNYIDAISTGFTSLYQLLWKHQDELLATDGPLARLANEPVRVFLRPSAVYETLQNESFHPDLLRNALDRDRFFDRLWAAAEFYPPIIKVIPAEREELDRGDIPIFTTRPNSRDLWSRSRGRISDFFDEPSMDLVRLRLQQLSDNDLAQQLWLILSSLATT